MSYTLRGRLESRFAAVLAPLLAAAALAAVVREWWPLALAVLMVGIGITLDVALYHRLLPYQPGWLALPLGLVELALVMGLARVLGIEAPLPAALALFGGAWLVAQVLGHAVFPLASLSYGEDGGELGRAGPFLAASVLAALAFVGGVAWAARPPTVQLAAGVHQGPLVLDTAQTLDGEPGAVVRGGIVVTADDVTIRDVAVLGGEHGIRVDGADGVLIEDTAIAGAVLDGINVRRSSVTIRDCHIESLQSPYAQGIDISFSFDLEPSLVERCMVTGGQEGIVANSARVVVRKNTVTSTTLRGISVNEMSMSVVSENTVGDALGVGIFCGDYSHCEITDNAVSGTRPDTASGDRTRLGYAVVAHFYAQAILDGNDLVRNHGRVGSFIDAQVTRR